MKQKMFLTAASLVLLLSRANPVRAGGVNRSERNECNNLEELFCLTKKELSP